MGIGPQPDKPSLGSASGPKGAKSHGSKKVRGAGSVGKSPSVKGK